MPDRVFLDSNILVYALTESDQAKKIKARELLSDRQAVLSTQVILETSNVLIRKLGAKPRDAAHLLRKLMSHELVPQTSEIVEETWRIADRYGLSVFDSAIVASALSARCNVLLTEDLQDQQRIETLTVRNPFIGKLTPRS